MHKSIKSIIISIALVSLCCACKGYLNTPPVGSLSTDGYYSTPAHIEQGVLGAYTFLRSAEFNQYFLFSEERSDNLWADPAPNGVRSCSEVSFARFGSTTGEVSSLWTTWYRMIHNVNTVLASIESVNFENESIKKQFKGELHFLRGLAHFELARVYGNVPISEKIQGSNDAKSLKQSAPADVIAFAIGELKIAEDLLPYEDGMKSAGNVAIGGAGRADKLVAQAMLARAYMTLKGWPHNDASAKASAKSYIETVLNYSKSNGDKYWAPNIDEWKKQFMTDPNISNKYQIFSIQHRNSSGNPASGELGVGLSGEYLPYGGGGGEMTRVFPEVGMVYEYESNNDPRGLGFAFLDGYDAFGATPTYGNQTKTFEWEGKTVSAFELSINTKYIPFQKKREPLGIIYDDSSSTSWPLNFPVIRLEDLMLYYAELLIEDGKIADAMGYVNKIRNRAGITPVPTDAAAADALKYVKRERKLELYCEGVRWFDQVRYGEWQATTTAKFNRYKVDGEYPQGVSLSNIENINRHYIPIPFSELKSVKDLYKQNPGWD